MPMTTAQLELSFQSSCARLAPSANHGASFRRAQWWFRRMRQIVDSALDWEPPPRPEQILLPSKDFRLWRA
jgi:hypothetical protein